MPEFKLQALSMARPKLQLVLPMFCFCKASDGLVTRAKLLLLPCVRRSGAIKGRAQK